MKRIFALLLAAVSLISLTACAQPEAKTVSKYQLAAPQYPQMAQYPDETKFSRPNGDFDSDGFNQVYDAWQADRRKQTDQPGKGGLFNLFLPYDAQQKSNKMGRFSIGTQKNLHFFLKFFQKSVKSNLPWKNRRKNRKNRENSSPGIRESAHEFRKNPAPFSQGRK